MTSPFKTFKEFSEAKGAIYTFTNNPAIVGILIVLSALIFLYFIYASFSIKKGESSAKSPTVLSLLIATSAFSLAQSVYTSQVEKMNNTSLKKEGVTAERVTRSRRQGWQVPMATVGMTVASGSIIQRRSRNKSRLGFQSRNSIWRSLSHQIRTGLSLMLRSTRNVIAHQSKRRPR